MAESLNRPVTLEELSATLSNMARGKSPGLDGVTIELYKCLWPTIGAEYLIIPV